jgi:prophage antirepressor-like protein
MLEIYPEDGNCSVSEISGSIQQSTWLISESECYAEIIRPTVKAGSRPAHCCHWLLNG